MQLKKDGFTIVAIDDPLEISARSLIDSNCIHGNKESKLDWTGSAECIKDPTFLSGLNSVDLKTYRS